MSTSASSRSAAKPAGAGRSASERAGIGAVSRAREGSQHDQRCYPSASGFDRLAPKSPHSSAPAPPGSKPLAAAPPSRARGNDYHKANAAVSRPAPRAGRDHPRPITHAKWQAIQAGGLGDRGIGRQKIMRVSSAAARTNCSCDQPITARRSRARCGSLRKCANKVLAPHGSRFIVRDFLLLGFVRSGI